VASHLGGLASIHDQFVWDLWWTEWQMAVCLRALLFPLPVLILSSFSHTLANLSSEEYTAMLNNHFKTGKRLISTSDIMNSQTRHGGVVDAGK
jgi:hypothetical protein